MHDYGTTGENKNRKQAALARIYNGKLCFLWRKQLTCFHILIHLVKVRVFAELMK